MPITLKSLRSAAGRSRPTRVAKSLTEARAKSQQTAFLCHSHADDALAEGLQVLLAEQGWEIYIDWQDTTLPSEPDRETAEKIKRKIVQLDWFLFLATSNSTYSRWCPWEIGYADGTKPLKKIMLIRTEDDSGKLYGNEYLQLYPEITWVTGNISLAAFQVGKQTGGVLIEKLS